MASASKAIRIPSIVDEDIRGDYTPFALPTGELGLTTIFGNRNFRSEQLRDYEAGYRAQASKNASFDVDAFYSFYHDLATLEPGTPFFGPSPSPPHLDFPFYWGNGMDGQDYGAEASINWRPMARWKISGGYSLLRMNLHLDPSSHDTLSVSAQKESPEHEFDIRSYFNIRRNLAFDNSLYFESAVPNYPVPSYVRWDSRLAWRLNRRAEISLVGQNLQSPRHFEYGLDDLLLATQPVRAIFGKLTWTFQPVFLTCVREGRRPAQLPAAGWPLARCPRVAWNGHYISCGGNTPDSPAEPPFIPCF